jgi:mono/diheme cytochrome c family protein
MIFREKATSFAPVAALAVVLLFGSRTTVLAHGEEHRHAEKPAGHMEAMYQVKAQIPEEYRVMDRTPVTPTKQSLAKGKELFLKQCAACHGQSGKGDGPAAAGLSTPPANFLELEHSAIYGPGEKFWLIGNGSPATGMPGFASQLVPLDRWHLVNYIYKLQEDAGGGHQRMHGH